MVMGCNDGYEHMFFPSMVQHTSCSMHPPGVWRRRPTQQQARVCRTVRQQESICLLH